MLTRVPRWSHHDDAVVTEKKYVIINGRNYQIASIIVEMSFWGDTPKTVLCVLPETSPF